MYWWTVHKLGSLCIRQSLLASIGIPGCVVECIGGLCTNWEAFVCGSVEFAAETVDRIKSTLSLFAPVRIPGCVEKD